MANNTPLIVTSVHSRVVEELTDAVGRAVEGRVEVRTGMEAATWVRARARGRVASIFIRMRGFLFPFRVDLGPRKSDRVIIATTNPFLLPAAVALRRPNARLVTLVYDLYPESLEVRLALPRPIRALVAAVTAFGLRRSAAVVFLGDRTREYVVDRYSLTCPTAVIPPGCGEIARPETPPSSVAELDCDLEGKVVISYVGNLGSMHDAATLAGALKIVLGEQGERCAAVLALRGDRARVLTDVLAPLPNVKILGRLNEGEWAWLMHRTDIALVSLDARAGLVSLPSKIFSSIAGGACVFAVAPDDSDLADIILRFRLGFVTSPGDPEVVATALRELMEDPVSRDARANLARSAHAKFTPKALATDWAALLVQVD